MDEWGKFLYQTALWTIAIVAAFEGARRIGNGQRTRTAIALATGGVLWSVAYGAFALYVASSMVQIDQEPGRFRQLPKDWGSELSSVEREKASLAYVTTAFRASGQLFEYFDQSGQWKRFTPNQEDLRQREASIEVHSQLERTSSNAWTQGVRWLLSVLVAVIAGIAVGAKMTANNALERS